MRFLMIYICPDNSYFFTKKSLKMKKKETSTLNIFMDDKLAPTAQAEVTGGFIIINDIAGI